MIKKYLLSTGSTTTKIERYILDVFKLNLQVYPGDIPGSDVGFNFILTNTKKDELLGDIRNRVSGLVDKVQKQFEKIDIQVTSIDLIDEERVRVTITVNDYSDSLDINLYN